MLKIKQGEDKVLNILVTDSNGVAVNCDFATSIRCGLIVKNVILKKYLDPVKEDMIDGYGEILLDSLKTNQLNIFLDREDSKLFPVGYLYASLLITFEDIDLTYKTTEYTYLVGLIEKGVMKDENIVI